MVARTTTPLMTQVGRILWTAAFMSPEQARGKSMDRCRGAMDLPHSTHADGGHNFVMTEASAGGQRHEVSDADYRVAESVLADRSGLDRQTLSGVYVPHFPSSPAPSSVPSPQPTVGPKKTPINMGCGCGPDPWSRTESTFTLRGVLAKVTSY